MTDLENKEFNFVPFEQTFRTFNKILEYFVRKYLLIFKVNKSINFQF